MCNIGLLFTVTVTSNASRHLKSPLAMGEMPFKIKRASSVPISVVIDTGVNSNAASTIPGYSLSQMLPHNSYQSIVKHKTSSFTLLEFRDMVSLHLQGISFL